MMLGVQQCNSTVEAYKGDVSYSTPYHSFSKIAAPNSSNQRYGILYDKPLCARILKS